MKNMKSKMDNERNIVIAARGLKKSFSNDDIEQVIFENLDLEIYKGDFTVLMGSSGAGKSTLLYALSGMDNPTAGKIEFCGEDITKYSDDELSVFRRRKCGFVFQQIYLMERMSLMDNVITAGRLTNRNKTEVMEKAQKLFDKVNIPKNTQQKLSSQISGGEAQRAGIVRAVINEPDVLFADEPTGALNSSNSDAVLDVLCSLSMDGQSIIMVTHDKKSAIRADRVIYLKDGKISGECRFDTYHGEDSARTAKLDSFLLEMGW